jgi:hypothetical protein
MIINILLIPSISPPLDVNRIYYILAKGINSQIRLYNKFKPTFGVTLVLIELTLTKIE